MKMTEDILADVVTGIDREKRKKYLEGILKRCKLWKRSGIKFSPKAEEALMQLRIEYAEILTDEAMERNVCDCEFTPYKRGDDDYGEESWHYLRKCASCGKEWYGLHCPHDGYQNTCPKCGQTPSVVSREL